MTDCSNKVTKSNTFWYLGDDDERQTVLIMSKVMSYTIKVKLCLVIHLMCELQSPKAAITGGDTGLSKSPKHKQTLNLWSFVLRVFNSSVKSFAPMKKDLSSNTCLSLDSCPELLP